MIFRLFNFKKSMIDTLCSQISTLQLCNTAINTKIIFVSSSLQLEKPQNAWKKVHEALRKNPDAQEILFAGVMQLRREKIELLAAHTANIPIQTLPTYLPRFEAARISADNLQLTSTHWAAIFNRPEDVHKHEVNLPDDEGRTPLHLAVLFGHTDVANKLVQEGAKPDLCTPQHGSPISQAARTNQTALIQLFAATGISITNSEFLTETQNEMLEGKIERIKSATIEEIATVLFYVKHRAPTKAKALFEQILQASPQYDILKQYYKEETVRRVVYHTWNIDWSIRTIKGLAVSQKISCMIEDAQISFSPFSGGFQPYFLRKMAKGTLNFIRLFPDQTSTERQLLNTLFTILSVGAAQRSPVELYTEWKTGHPVLISVTIQNPPHAVTVLLCDYFFLLCNQGHATRKNVEVERFHKVKLNIEVFDRLCKPFESTEEYENYFFTTLPSTIGFRKGFSESMFERFLSLPNQLIDNCSWKSPETAVYTFFLFSGLHMHGLLPYQTYNVTRFTETAKYYQTLFYNWNLDQKLTNLSKYLDVVTTKDSPFITNHEIIDELIKQYATLQTATWIYPELRQRMKAIELLYPILVT